MCLQSVNFFLQKQQNTYKTMLPQKRAVHRRKIFKNILYWRAMVFEHASLVNLVEYVRHREK